MTFLAIGACELFATFGAVSLSASGLLILFWPFIGTRIGTLAPSLRARWLFAARLSPTLLGVLASASVTLPSFLEFEPRDTAEVPGPALEWLAAAGLALSAIAVARLIGSGLRTRGAVRGWARSAKPVALEGVELPTLRLESVLPVVALAGWRCPRLFVSGAVLDSCGPRLIAAIAAHETGHRRGFDNLKRLILSACADLLVGSRAEREIVAAWNAAAEEAADDEAVASGIPSTDLAEALVAVARLTPAGRWPFVPAAAFYLGGSLERRVRRLLNGAASPLPPRRPLRAVLVGLALVAGWLLAAEALHRPAHRLFEHGVSDRHGELRGLVVGTPRA